MLIEEGRLEMDKPALRWLPELANRRVLRHLDGPIDEALPARRDITVRDLLAFTLGFGILFDNPPIQKRIDELQLVNGQPVPITPHTPDEWMARFATLPLMHQPGESWMYNTGSLLQGVLVKRAAEQDFDVFVRERITGPLGMDDTGFFVPPEKLDRFAGCGYFTRPPGNKTRMDKDGMESAYAAPPVFPSGAGGLVSTVDDYLIFARMLLNGGKHGSTQILRTETVREMTRDQLTPAQKAASAKALFPGFFDTHGWGYGVGISTAPDAVSQVPGRYGWDGGFGTSFVNDPDRNLLSIVMTQSSDFLFNGTRDQFWRELYAAMAKHGGRMRVQNPIGYTVRLIQLALVNTWPLRARQTKNEKKPTGGDNAHFQHPVPVARRNGFRAAAGTCTRSAGQTSARRDELQGRAGDLLSGLYTRRFRRRVRWHDRARCPALRYALPVWPVLVDGGSVPATRRITHNLLADDASGEQFLGQRCRDVGAGLDVLLHLCGRQRRRLDRAA